MLQYIESSFICKTLVISYDSTARFVLDLVRNTADSFSTNASHRPVSIMFLSGTHMFTAKLVFLLHHCLAMVTSDLQKNTAKEMILYFLKKSLVSATFFEIIDTIIE